MPQYANTYGALAGLRSIQNIKERIRLTAVAEAEAERLAKQQDFENEMKRRQVGAQEMAAQPSSAVGRIPNITTYGPDGKTPVRGPDVPNTPVYVAPADPPRPEARTDYGDFLDRYARGIGLKSSAELDHTQEAAARKIWGQADDRPQSPLFIMQGPEGPTAINRFTAEAQPVTQGGQPIGPTPSAAVRTADAELKSGLDAISNIRGSFNPDWVGPLAGRWGAARQAMPDIPFTKADDIDPKQAQFRAAVGGLTNEMIRLITGAAVGVQEEARIMREIPTMNDRAEVFQAKLDQTEMNRRNLLGRRQQGFAPPAAAGQDAPTAAPERKPIPGIPGGEAELRNGRWIRVK